MGNCDSALVGSIGALSQYELDIESNSGYFQSCKRCYYPRPKFIIKGTVLGETEYLAIKCPICKSQIYFQKKEVVGGRTEVDCYTD